MTAPIQTCYRHSDRRAGVACQRCDRPICPNCMVQASVGFHCPECAKGGQRVYTARTLLQPKQPIVTQILIGLNVAVFLFAMTQSGFDFSNGGGRFQTDYGLLGSPPAPFDSVQIGVAHGEWYRLITGGFMHAGILHLAFNMFALWFLGSQLEMALG